MKARRLTYLPPVEPCNACPDPFTIERLPVFFNERLWHRSCLPKGIGPPV